MEKRFVLLGVVLSAFAIQSIQAMNNMHSTFYIGPVRGPATGDKVTVVWADGKQVHPFASAKERDEARKRIRASRERRKK